MNCDWKVKIVKSQAICINLSQQCSRQMIAKQRQYKLELCGNSIQQNSVYDIHIQQIALLLFEHNIRKKRERQNKHIKQQKEKTERKEHEHEMRY